MTKDEENFAALLAGLSVRQVHEFCIEAVRRVRKQGDKANTVRLDPSTIQRELVPLLRAHHGKQDESHVPVASLLKHLNNDWATPILEFFVWMERAGLVFRYGGTTDEVVQRIRLLPAGLKFFDSSDDAHPLVPGWVDRLKKRTPRLTDDTYDLLVDSHECFERGLLRASIALLGTAVEGGCR